MEPIPSRSPFNAPKKIPKIRVTAKPIDPVKRPTINLMSPMITPKNLLTIVSGSRIILANILILLVKSCKICAVDTPINYSILT